MGIMNWMKNNTWTKIGAKNDIFLSWSMSSSKSYNPSKFIHLDREIKCFFTLLQFTFFWLIVPEHVLAIVQPPFHKTTRTKTMRKEWNMEILKNVRSITFNWERNIAVYYSVYRIWTEFRKKIICGLTMLSYFYLVQPLICSNI